MGNWRYCLECQNGLFPRDTESSRGIALPWQRQVTSGSPAGTAAGGEVSSHPSASIYFILRLGMQSLRSYLQTRLHASRSPCKPGCAFCEPYRGGILLHACLGRKPHGWRQELGFLLQRRGAAWEESANLKGWVLNNHILKKKKKIILKSCRWLFIPPNP